MHFKNPQFVAYAFLFHFMGINVESIFSTIPIDVFTNKRGRKRFIHFKPKKNTILASNA